MTSYRCTSLERLFKTSNFYPDDRKKNSRTSQRLQHKLVKRISVNDVCGIYRMRESHSAAALVVRTANVPLVAFSSI